MVIRGRHIGQIIKSRGVLLLLLCLLLICISSSSSAQTNPFLRQRTSERTIIRSGQIYKPDSILAARADSARIAKLADTLKTLTPDSLAKVSDSVRMQLPDSVRRAIFGTDSLSSNSVVLKNKAKDSLSARQLKRLEKRANHKTYFSDSMSLRRVTWTSLFLPGFGQIYNKQYWKLPILYGTVGASLGLCLWSNSKYKPLQAKFNRLTDESMSRTPQLNAVQSEMIKYNTMKQVFMIATIASYLYFIGDAAVKYSTNDVSSVNKATTLAMICPGAGQIYNKSYWRVPLVIGGFATTIYCIDWNNRGYQRFSKAYRLKADADLHPEKYPEGSRDEFGGRYSATFLKDLRNSYRRNRDLCIILTAGLYVLQIIDAHVDAHLRDYDISRDLSVSISPMIGYTYNPMTPLSTGGATLGVNLGFRF